ncbi:transposase [Escherichia coli]
MIDVLGPEKRRRRTTQEKIAIVQQSFEPGMTVSLVARQHGVAASQLFLWRKQLYKVTQRKVLPRLMNDLDQRYYLAVLQVYNDSQIRNHSNYNDVRDYINEVMYSFSRKAPKESYLVIKHHPMDRGHRLYRPLIKRLSKEYGLGERVIYVHDLPMPELLRHAKAVVTINSTAGISALIHNKPLKVMGNALYDIKGLTYQGHLHQFWQADFKPDMKLFKKFRGYLLVKTQVNGVYYGESQLHCDTITLEINSALNNK